MEVNPPGKHFQACEEQEDHGEYLVQVYEGKIMPYLSVSLLWLNDLVYEEKAVDVVYADFSKAFNILW